MSKSVVYTLLVVALLLGGAVIVYQRMFAPPPEQPIAKTPEPPDPPTPKPAADADAGPPAEADAGPPVPLKATVVSSRGLVEVKGEDGEWRPIEVGEELQSDMAVRTGRNGEANLSVGDGIEVRISPLSEFSVRDLQTDLSRIRLEEGHVAASVDPEKQRALQVEARGTDALAESKGGEFGVVTDGRGQLTVATETGSVKLSSKGKTVEVGAGETSLVTASGDGPSAPMPIPKSLFLKLQDPSRTRINKNYTIIEGASSPGSVVRVQGRIARTDSKGRFKVKVKLKDGSNQVSANVLDAMGRTQETRSGEIVVDREKPTIEGDMQWGTGQGGGG